MGKEQDNELKPLNYFEGLGFWVAASMILIYNPGHVLPVWLGSSKSESPQADFFLLLGRDDQKTFMQAEDFNSKESEEAFLKHATPKWENIQPGIYQLDITEIVKGLL